MAHQDDPSTLYEVEELRAAVRWLIEADTTTIPCRRESQVAGEVLAQWLAGEDITVTEAACSSGISRTVLSREIRRRFAELARARRIPLRRCTAGFDLGKDDFLEELLAAFRRACSQ